MRWICVFIILGATAFGQNAYGPDFLNLHCTAPDPLAQTLFNIQPRSGLVPDRSANGNVVIYCDAATTTFKASFNGGAYNSLFSPAGVAIGSQFVSNGIGNSGVYQTKTVIDARDIGVDCTYTNDSAAALNTLTNNQNGFGGTLTGATLVFPPGCHVKLSSSNWLIVNQGAFSIQGASRGVAPFASTSTVISYCGSSAVVPVIDMESVFGGEIANLVIETKGTGCSTGTITGITVDKANAHSNVNTTDNYLHDLTITTNLGGGAGPTNWTGLSISPVSGSNVEDTRLWNSKIICQSTSNSSSGVNLNSSFNAKVEEFKHNQINICAFGYTQNNGDWLIDGGDLSNNGADINIGASSDPSLIQKIVSESNQMIGPGNAGNWPTTIVSSHVGWSGGTASNGLCGMDFGSFGTVGGSFVLIGSGADAVPVQDTTATPLCASINQDILDIGGQWSNASVGSPNQLNILSTFQLPKNLGRDYASINGGIFRVTNAAPSSSGTLQNIGYGFISHNGMDMLGLGFNANSNQDCVSTGRLCVGTDGIFLGEEHLSLTGMWPIPQYLQSCTYTGTAGSTHWTTAILPIDATGKRGGVYPFGGNWGCFNAASTLTVSNFLTVVWPRVQGAANYAVILMNPSNNAQGELISTIADPGSGLTATTTITSGSTGDTFSYLFPNYWESAKTTIEGESLTVAAPLISGGTAPVLTGTGACATTSTQKGAWAGQVTCTGTTGASTLIITTGITAPNGTSCWASDVTHTLAGSQSGVGTASCTMSFTSVTANDVLTFGAVAY